jgi:dipeptidyl aminopeptidase/acylaminoacyl peptidase
LHFWRLHVFVPRKNAEFFVVHYTSEDGKKKLDGLLLLPAGYTEGKKVPTIVIVYGGLPSYSFFDHHFVANYFVVSSPFLVARGYAVFSPGFPLDPENPRDQMPGIVLPGVRYLIDNGISDPAKISLWGSSYGGYCVLNLISQSKLFSSAVAVAVISNLTSFYLKMSEGILLFIFVRNNYYFEKLFLFNIS